jgi:putative heme-binding domain-containing protein
MRLPLFTSRPALRAPAFLSVLIAALLFLGGTAPLRAQSDDALPALVEMLGQTDDPQFHLDVLKGLSEGLKGRRAVKMPAGWEEISLKLGKSPNPQVRELAQSLSLTFGSPSALAALRHVLMDVKADPTARKNALESLLQAKDKTLASDLAGLVQDPVLRSPALRGLANFDDPKTPSLIVGLYPKLESGEKKVALNTLAARVAFAKPLLAAVADKTIPSRDLTADIVRQLRNFKDKEINAQVEQLWGQARESQADKLAEIAKYKAMLQTQPSGKPGPGRVVFSRLCQQCHTLFETGGKVGPELTGSNRADLDYILQNVIDPNAIIPNDYRTSILETKDDRVITGIVTRQDANAVTIVVPGEEIVMPRNEIKSLAQGELSMMPEGLLQTLTEPEVRDLIAYLKSPAQVPLPPAASK